MPHTDTPSDAVIVKRMEELGGRYDTGQGAWIVPTEAEGELRLLLADTGRPVEWRDAKAA